ncbi:MAG: hypothetical protein KDA88_04770 [Planctomycetaceae bacterium]|nr:hypothetical protein [Planctomycetaceae bacterium]MCB9950119.1 hypothetical protein [Planctomycetaceae bacterium]
MQLTGIKRRTLWQYWQFHTRGWRLTTMLYVAWPYWLLLAAVAFIVNAQYANSPWYVGFLTGACAGAFLRDVGRIQQSYRVWPMVEEITKWDRVEELMRESDESVEADG